MLPKPRSPNNMPPQFIVKVFNHLYTFSQWKSSSLREIKITLLYFTLLTPQNKTYEDYNPDRRRFTILLHKKSLGIYSERKFILLFTLNETKLCGELQQQYQSFPVWLLCTYRMGLGFGRTGYIKLVLPTPRPNR